MEDFVDIKFIIKPDYFYISDMTKQINQIYEYQFRKKNVNFEFVIDQNL